MGELEIISKKKSERCLSERGHLLQEILYVVTIKSLSIKTKVSMYT